MESAISASRWSGVTARLTGGPNSELGKGKVATSTGAAGLAAASKMLSVSRPGGRKRIRPSSQVTFSSLPTSRKWGVGFMPPAPGLAARPMLRQSVAAYRGGWARNTPGPHCRGRPLGRRAALRSGRRYAARPPGCG
ncbi:hypothetical protein G6F24_014672 [Rhizopus arrhizus]|nr:hypothetical protein G6F24_014672 [Rhizopus arrhizus]